jgi:hypothetical protein
MRTLALLGLLVACERQETIERLAPPGPERLEVMPAPPPPAPPTTLQPAELEQILAILQGKGAVDPKRLANPNVRPDPSWDPRRAWLREYRKVGQTITLDGGASAIEDVTQFAKRLEVHPMFEDVTILPRQREPRTASAISLTGARIEPIWVFEIRVKSPGADPNAPEVRRSFSRPKP